MQTEYLRIIVGSGLDMAFSRRSLLGILAYAGDKPHWHVESFIPDEAMILRALSRKADGLIGYALTPKIIEAARLASCPLVPMVQPECGLLGVEIDNAVVGKMAAEHLLELGIKHFASALRGRATWAINRSRAFMRRVEEAGYSCHEFDLDISGFHGHWPRVFLDQDSEPIPLLAELPKPLGLFAGNDVNGYQLLYICQAMGLRVPDEVAIVGVDNDEILCNACRPQLSSVITNHEQVGYCAAELLDKRLKGHKLPEQDILVQPRGMVKRKSTDVLAVADTEIVEAVRYIRDHVAEGITPKLLMQKIPMGRRSFENRFKSAMGCTVLDEIIRSRVNRAKEMLGTTDMPMSQVAPKSGFANISRLSDVFKQKTGFTPSQYRNQSRQRPGM